jgi:hypothetical protein
MNKKWADRSGISSILSPQRGQMQINHVQPIVEIFPKGTGSDPLFQISVGCRDNPDINPSGMGISYPAKLFFL